MKELLKEGIKKAPCRNKGRLTIACHMKRDNDLVLFHKCRLEIKCILNKFYLIKLCLKQRFSSQSLYSLNFCL